MPKYLAKSEMTKQKLKDSFMLLYAEKSYFNITVNDIAERAGVHRCTFYVYFENINELLREIEDELIEDMAQIDKNLHLLDIYENRNDSSSARRIFSHLFEYFLQHKFYIVTLINPSGDLSFTRKLKKLIHDDFCETLKQNKCSYGSNQDYIIWYMSSGIIEIIYRWLKTDGISIDEVIEIMITMMYFNPFLVLS